MAFTPKTWQNSPSTSTPINAAALIDLEERVTDYSDSLIVPSSQTIAAASTIAPSAATKVATVTGSTTITGITATFAGHELKLLFTSTAQLTDGSNLKLNGNFSGAADRTISLYCNGTNWYELARSDNGSGSSVGIELGYAEITSNYVQTGAGNSDVTGLSTTVTVGSRPIRIEFACSSIQNSSASPSGLTSLAINEGSTILTTAAFGGLTTANVTVPVTRSVRLAPSAGSHTYKIVLGQVVAGNSTIAAAATSPAYIWVTEV
jgi:hypothetical protein